MAQKTGIIFIAVWVLVLFVFSRERASAFEKMGWGRGRVPYSRLFVLFAILPLVLWAGLREGRGYVDTNAYIAQFSRIPKDLTAFKEYLQGYDRDIGFSWYLYYIKRFFGDNYRPFLMITAIIHCVSVAFFFRRFSRDFVFSLCLFIISTEYYGWIFNGIRQFLAVSIALFAVWPFLKKRYIISILIVLLASTFHQTALILLPIGLIARGKPWSYTTLIAIGLALFALTMTDRFTDFLKDVTETTQYAGEVEMWQEAADEGVNPFRVAVYLVPTIMAYLGRRQLAELHDPVVDMSVNMSIVGSSLWLIAMATSGIYMGRIPIYVDLFNYLLLPVEVRYLFPPRDKTLITELMILLYLVFYYYLFHVQYGLI